MDSREPAPIDIRAGGASLGDLQRRISIENTRATGGDMANPKECDDVIFRRQAFQKVPHIAFSGKVQPLVGSSRYSTLGLLMPVL